jgi:hypothetical protein
MIGKYMIKAIAHSNHAMAATATMAVKGDRLAQAAMLDFFEEQGMNTALPFKVGDEILVCQVTLYYVGRVQEIGLGWFRLEQASWVCRTGRLSVLRRIRKFHGSEFGERRPRTEYVDTVIIHTDGGISIYEGPWELPTKSLPND